MPRYEYHCEGCGEQFELTQSLNARAEDTICPHCQAQKAVRLMSSFASKIVGDHKPGFNEMKAYSMHHERMDKFKKLPPVFGKRAPAPPISEVFSGSPTSKSSDQSGS